MLWTRAVSPPPVAPATPEGRAAAAYLGLAVGDALGATVEFLTPREIQHRHGTHRDIVVSSVTCPGLRRSQPPPLMS